MTAIAPGSTCAPIGRRLTAAILDGILGALALVLGLGGALLLSLMVYRDQLNLPQDGSERLFGYNHAPSGKLVGPGYFVAVPTRGQPAWAERGPVVVDYFQVPDGPVPGEWPKVVPNSKGLQRFVYNGTRDFMRRVSAHVSIGAAHKGEKSLDHYFVLVRQDG